MTELIEQQSESLARLQVFVSVLGEPKVAEVGRGLTRIEQELDSASGREATRLRDRLNEGRTFLSELQDLREELLRIAALPYKPNLNDGVIINAAPFHKLFRLHFLGEGHGAGLEEAGEGRLRLGPLGVQALAPAREGGLQDRSLDRHRARP